MTDYEHIEKEVEKRYKTREKRKRKRMPVTGKGVFLIQRLKARNPAGASKKLKKQKNDRIHRRKNSRKIG